MSFKLPIKFKAGFTLIEMMVAVSVFVLVAFVVTSTLISVSNANRKAQELKQVMDNLNFSIQSMVLRMREGTRYSCFEIADDARAVTIGNISNTGRSCTGDGFGEAIAFFDPTPAETGSKGTLVKYYLEPVSGIDGAEVRHIVKVDNPNIGPDPLDVTSPEVDITALRFKVGGVGGGAGEKPHVIINVSGVAKLRSGDESYFNLQTFVSQHN